MRALAVLLAVAGVIAALYVAWGPPPTLRPLPHVRRPSYVFYAGRVRQTL
jgi:hypothetical protein